MLSCWLEDADWPFGKASFPFVVSSPTPEALQPIAPGWRVSAYPGKTWENPSVPRQGYEVAGTRRSPGSSTPPRIEEGRAGCNPCRGRCRNGALDPGLLRTPGYRLQRLRRLGGWWFSIARPRCSLGQGAENRGCPIQRSLERLTSVDGYGRGRYSD